MDTMKVPGPDHPITIAANPRRVRAYYQGHVIADSARALNLQEATYPLVLYFSRDDVSMEFLTRTDKTSYCPYKGVASYYTLQMDGHFAENAVWTYEDPYPAMEPIRGRLAFYPQHVEIYPIEAPSPPDAIRDAIEHTDSGSGASQREHWKPNVTEPWAR